MFEAVFHDEFGFLGGLVVVAIVVGGAAWGIARRRQVAHAVWWLPLGFCLTGVLGVTLALRAGEHGSAVCVINHQLTEPLYTTQGQWNLAMFVPVGLFGLLALRRPVPVLAGVLALPCLVELTQALAPFAGGVCDSADAEMNVLGGLTGLALGLLAVRGRVAWRAWARPALVLGGVLGLLGAAVLQSAVTLDHVDGSTVRDARGDERRAAERAVRQAFGARYRVGDVRISPGTDGYNGSMSVQFAGGFPAELMWPGGRRLTVDFANTHGPGFAVPGATRPHGTREAYRIADSYMRAHYPWAGAASWHATRPVGKDEGGDGWVTSWRFKEHGVAMPRSLDVRISRAGRLYGLTVDLGPRHLDLPADLLSAREAERTVEQRERKNRADTDKLRVRALDLTTERSLGNRGRWRAVWSVQVTDLGCEPGADQGDAWAANSCEPYVTVVDAATGRLVA
ncbi:VanZ family protein [Streptomyces sp. IBSBF 3136]|uniref:VanZ family protein n=1 Tax=Streptomyces sp. IBSBF 3136 TaxID=2903524 RepID=UPI002FDBC3BF